MAKSVEAINRKIRAGKAVVLTADEMSLLVKRLGPKKAAEKVDVVTTGTFGAMCSSGVWLNFGHSDPPIKMQKVWLNDVEAYTGVAAVDAYIGATQMSEKLGMAYGGGHVIEDLVRGRRVRLRAVAYGTDCYPRREVETDLGLEDLNQATMSNPRNAYQRYNVATNSSSKTLHTYMGKLLPGFGNATYSGAGVLSPIMNDPAFETIGIGTRIFLCGGTGYVVGSGTQHNPEGGFATLMVQGDLKMMKKEYLRGATFNGYGSTLYVGIGVPIPILNEKVARSTAVTDADITTKVLDYSIPRRDRTALSEVTYEELRSGTIEIGGKEVRTASLSSQLMAKRIAFELKDRIDKGSFMLTQCVERLSSKGASRPMVVQRLHLAPENGRTDAIDNQGASVGETGTHLTKGWESAHAGKGAIIARDDGRCTQCGACVSLCPTGAHAYGKGQKVTLTVKKCTGCGLCTDGCPVGALALTRRRA
jgi:uncharacterized protein (DUF39 family)/Pyruvate/2-oxoacid:ferredoxin oxidoreductase delta subunit